MRTIESLKRGLEVLRLLNEPGMDQVRALHRASGLPKPTIVRILETLIEDGYIVRTDAGRYRLATKVIELSQGFDPVDGLLAAARPTLDAFRERHVWPSDLAVLDRGAMVIVNTSHTPGTMTLNRSVGSRLPVLKTALGRAFLAYARPEVRRDTLNHLGLAEGSKGDRSGERKAVLGLLERVRARGYATSDHEFLKSVVAVAVPILIDGTAVASVNMMAVASAMSAAQAKKAFVDELKALAAAVSDILGEGRLDSAGPAH